VARAAIPKIQASEEFIVPTGVHKKIRAAEAGQLPAAICRLPSGWLIAGDVQHLRGYCVLLHDPVAKDLNALSIPERTRYALDTARVGDALLAVVGAYRVNYEIWGNLDPALHTHIVPRFANESDKLRVLPPRQGYDWDHGPAFDLARDGEWMARVRDYLQNDATT